MNHNIRSIYHRNRQFALNSVLDPAIDLDMDIDEGSKGNPGRGALLVTKEDTAKHIGSTEGISGRSVQKRLVYHALSLRVICLYAPSALSSSSRDETLEPCEWLFQAR